MPNCLLLVGLTKNENTRRRRRSRHRASRMDLGMTFNPSKALIALVGLICMTVLIAVGAIDQDQGLPIITMIVGYSVGNGMAALSNKQVEPIIRKKDPK
jgi:ABC-type xylose transport system permease subunit